MSDELSAQSPEIESTQTRLKQLATLLRNADHLDPQAQKSLATLLEQLVGELDAAGVAPSKTAHLAETISEVARSLHDGESGAVSDTDRERLRQAAVAAELEAPASANLVYRFIDVLSSIGI